MQGKVRGVHYDFDSCRLATLSTDGFVKLLDPARDLRTTRTVRPRARPPSPLFALQPCLAALRQRVVHSHSQVQPPVPCSVCKGSGAASPGQCSLPHVCLWAPLPPGRSSCST
jgi:hypothetical protein